jgi:hypothetical protein
VLLAWLCLGAADPELYITYPSPEDIAEMRRRVQKAPHQQRWLEHLAVMLLWGEQTGEAERLFQRSYRIRPNARNCYHLGMFREKRRPGSGKALLRQAHRFAPHGQHIAQALGLVEPPDKVSRGYDQVRTQPNSQQESQDWKGTLDLPGPLKVRAAGPRLLAIGPTTTYVLDRQTRQLVCQTPSQVTFAGATIGDREYGPQTSNLWEHPEQLLAADEHHLLLNGVAVLDPRTGKGTCWYSGGDRWPEDVTFLVPGGRYIVHEGVLEVNLCDAESGEVVWNCVPPTGTSQMDLIKMTDQEIWVHASYTGRVYAYSLSQRRLLWERWHWQLP